MPNSFAYLTLIIWPLVATWLYKKNKVIPATFWTIVGGYLLLPVGVDFDFPLIPALNKATIPAIMAFFGCKYLARVKISLLPPGGLERNLIILFFIGSVGMVFTNGDAINEINRFIPGLSYRDTVSVILSQGLLLLPFTIALQLIKTYEDQLQLLKLLVLAGLLYSVLIIFEIRMSPQLHKWIYGFFPHSWGQQVRYGGFRPVVFLGHGLWVSIFLVVVLGAALVLAKIKMPVTKKFNNFIVMYLVLLLYVSKGFGAMILGVVLLIPIKFMSISISGKIAYFVSTVAIFYPLLCIIDVFPHQYLVELIEPINSRQAGSLGYRFNQEVMLLERAKDKFVFGWGGWDRYKLADSVTDGYWIILFGKYGVIGFSAIFGLMYSAVIKAGSSARLMTDHSAKTLLIGHSLIVAVIMIDQIPNDSMNSLFWLIIGALIGRSQAIKTEKSIVTIPEIRSKIYGAL
ncbi:hypothetical protein N9J88_05360 [Porticoccaceae bacterium]|nr:hypothetical protein [Porticoccaceae bacterium]